MPVKLFKPFHTNEKDRSKLEDAINQFEIQIEKEGMLGSRASYGHMELDDFSPLNYGKYPI